MVVLKKQDETFDQFFTNLRQLSKYCNYGELSDGLIRDRIIEGVCDIILLQEKGT